MTLHAVGMDRHAATRRVLKAIAVGPDVVRLPFVAADGSQPLVVTTPNEYLSQVIVRVEAAGGAANIALAEANKFIVFTIEGVAAGASQAAGNNLMNNEMSMGMFWLRATRSGASRHFRIRVGQANIPAHAHQFAYAN